MKKYLNLLIGAIIGSGLTALSFQLFFQPKPPLPPRLAPFQTDVAKATAENQGYRKVLFTGARSQLVVMSIPPGGEVGAETHKYVEQILYFQSGTGVAVLDGKTTPVGPGDVVVVTPGTLHNFINTGNVPLKITTSYAPPNHIDGTFEATKAEADANTADETYGETPR